MQKKIWTIVDHPFRMGGEMKDPICTKVEVLAQTSINGFKFFSFKTPKGSIKVAEAQTGGIISDSFSQLEKDIQGFSKEFLQGQIDGAKTMAIKARKISNTEFFRYYRH